MLIKITSALIILLINTGIVSAQYFESVEKEAERILISLSDGDSLNPTDLNELKNFLSSEINIELSESLPDFNSHSIDSLTNHLTEFELESQKISTDSAFVLFNDWYLHFQNIFYEYSKEKFFSSDKTKILFFSASMSCQCTLEMCKKQTIEVLNLAKEKNLDYWIVDSFEHNELQIRFETLFAPSLIVFDENNQVLLKIEYDEKMIIQLTEYFNKNAH